MSLHCIWSIQPSSIGAVPMIRFSAWHDKCLPASAFVAMKDKTLVVVFPSAEVCNNIMITFTGVDSAAPSAPGMILLSCALFFFFSSEEPPIYLLRCVRWRSSPHILKAYLSLESGGSALTIAEILDQSLVILLEGSTYFLRMKKWLLSFRDRTVITSSLTGNWFIQCTCFWFISMVYVFALKVCKK